MFYGLVSYRIIIDEILCYKKVCEKKPYRSICLIYAHLNNWWFSLTNIYFGICILT